MNKQKLKIIVISLFCLLLQNSVLGQSIYELFKIKKGTLINDETWSGKILISHDVTIPTNREIKIKPNTWLVFNNTEIIVEGKLTTLKKDKNSVQILNLSDEKVQSFLKDNNCQALDIQAKPVNLKPLKDEWRSYARYQYIMLWTIIYVVFTALY